MYSHLMFSVFIFTVLSTLVLRKATYLLVLYFYVPSDAYLLLLELYVGGLHVHLK